MNSMSFPLAFMYLCVPLWNWAGSSCVNYKAIIENMGWDCQESFFLVLLGLSTLRESQLFYHVGTQAEAQIGRKGGLLPTISSMWMSVSFRSSWDLRRWKPLPTLLEGDLEGEAQTTQFSRSSFLDTKIMWGLKYLLLFKMLSLVVICYTEIGNLYSIKYIFANRQIYVNCVNQFTESVPQWENPSLNSPHKYERYS